MQNLIRQRARGVTALDKTQHSGVIGTRWDTHWLAGRSTEVVINIEFDGERPFDARQTWIADSAIRDLASWRTVSLIVEPRYVLVESQPHQARSVDSSILMD